VAVSRQSLEMSQHPAYSQYSAEVPSHFGESGGLEVPNYPEKKH
jgi:hypothetical protein